MDPYIEDDIIEIFNKELKPYKYHIENLKFKNTEYPFDYNSIFDQEKMDLAIRIETEIYIKLNIRLDIFEVYNFLSLFMKDKNKDK